MKFFQKCKVFYRTFDKIYKNLEIFKKINYPYYNDFMQTIRRVNVLKDSKCSHSIAKAMNIENVKRAKEDDR